MGRTEQRLNYSDCLMLTIVFHSAVDINTQTARWFENNWYELWRVGSQRTARERIRVSGILLSVTIRALIYTCSTPIMPTGSVGIK